MKGKGMVGVSTLGPSHPNDVQDVFAHRVSKHPCMGAGLGLPSPVLSCWEELIQHHSAGGSKGCWSVVTGPGDTKINRADVHPYCICSTAWRSMYHQDSDEGTLLSVWRGAADGLIWPGHWRLVGGAGDLLTWGWAGVLISWQIAERFMECPPEEFHLWSPGGVVPWKVFWREDELLK